MNADATLCRIDGIILIVMIISANFFSLTATSDFTHSNSNKKPKVPEFFFAFRRKFIKNEALLDLDLK